MGFFDPKPKARPTPVLALREGDSRFLTQVQAAQQADRPTRATAILWLMLVLVASAIGWAAVAQVDQVTRTDGRVVPVEREQVIASLEGGILRELKVREGMQVQAGQELVQLDPTRFEAQQNEGEAKRLALKGAIARLTAEANERPLAFPDDVQKHARVVDAETEAWRARRRALEEAIATQRHSIGLLQRETDVAQTMAAKGLMSDVEVMRLQRQVNDLRLQIQERSNRFRQEAASELVRVQSELAQLQEQMVARDDVLRRTVLTSPVKGLVKNIRAHTVGGVIGAGAAIMEIVPLGDTVLVEARIKPAEIGFVRVGQPAVVKLSAYEYVAYGGLEGTVDYISPDALGDPDRAQQADATYYRALVRCKPPKLQARGEPLPVLPGMTASIEVATGRRSVLSFLLRPLMRGGEAFRER